GAERSQVLASFPVITDEGVVLEGTFLGKVTLELKDVPWTEGLLRVCSGGGCVVDFSARPVVVRPPEPPEPPSAPSPPSAPAVAPVAVPSPPSPVHAPSSVPAVPSAPAPRAAPTPPTPPTAPVVVPAPAPAAPSVPVRFEWRSGPEESAPSVEGSVRFSWAGPVHRARVGEGVWLALTWIPFAPDHQAVLPLVYRCPSEDAPGAGGTPGLVGYRGSSVLEPLSLPLTVTQRIELAGGATLVLEPARIGSTMRADSEEVPCSALDQDLLVRWQSGGSSTQGVGRLAAADIGDYIFLAMGETSAFVIVGADVEGGLEVAEVRAPASPDGGRGLELRRHRLARDGSSTVSLGDGARGGGGVGPRVELSARPAQAAGRI
ncbi:MAG: hypothetical protein MI919_01350, partial [Holophagales bacterium]|nr:hypothetical protein [Holophagales bacterium]